LWLIVKKLISRILLLVLLLFCIGISVFFFYAGYWLQVNDVPAKADAIVALAGPPTRAFYAADLYNQGYASKIYITVPVREHALQLIDELGIEVPRAEQIYRQVLIKKSVPPDKIYFIGKDLISTADEAETINRFFKSRDCRLLVVTSPFHVRRCRIVFHDMIEKCDIRVLGTTYEPFPEKWWTNQESARNVLMEMFKIAFYMCGGRFHTHETERSPIGAEEKGSR